MIENVMFNIGVLSFVHLKFKQNMKKLFLNTNFNNRTSMDEFFLI